MKADPSAILRLLRQQLMHWARTAVRDGAPPWQVYEALRGAAACTAAWERMGRSELLPLLEAIDGD